MAARLEQRAAVLLERLPRKDFREDVGRVVVRRHVLDRHAPSAPHLAHLIELAVDVS